MKYELLAKSSGEEPYQVVFIFDEENLSITCNCKAGAFGKLCKHKTALLTGDASMLAELEQSEPLKELLNRIPATAYPQLVEQVHTAELQVDEAKRALQKAKKSKKSGAHAPPPQFFSPWHNATRSSATADRRFLALRMGSSCHAGRILS